MSDAKCLANRFKQNEDQYVHEARHRDPSRTITIHTLQVSVMRWGRVAHTSFIRLCGDASGGYREDRKSRTTGEAEIAEERQLTIHHEGM